MMTSMRLLLFLLFTTTSCSLASHAAEKDFGQKCSSLHGNYAPDLDNIPARILSAQVKEIAEAGTVCEITGYAHRQTQFTVRIPESWNDRLLFQGCGGFCGLVYIDRANDALARGYATVATNMGHVGSPLDALWAYDNPEAEIDFAYRATHRTTQVAKTVLRAFKNRPKRSFFRGCSTGGRQGMISAQRFPDDFDGIISESPVLNYIHGSGLQLLWSVLVPLAHERNMSLSETDVEALSEHVMAVCDAIDGSSDGVLDDPRACSIDWNAEICSDSKAHCLSNAAKRAAQAIYAGPVSSVSGSTLRGPEFGSELNWIGTYVGQGDRAPVYTGFIGDLFRFLAFEKDPGPSWSPRLQDFASYVDRSRSQHEMISALNPDLKPFAARGGKLLIVHGWSDQSVVPDSTLQYVDQLNKATVASKINRDFVKTFMVPGMNHCGGGPGVNEIDWLSVLEHWDKTGVAPGKVSASRQATEDTPALQRMIFAYPSAPGPVTVLSGRGE